MLVTFPWDFCSLSCNLGFLLALKWRWAEQGPERAQGFAALQSFTPEPISASCACGGKKKKPCEILQLYSGLGAASAMGAELWRQRCQGQRWHCQGKLSLVLLPLGTGFSARHFLRVQSCEREKQRAGGPLVVAHAQKVCGQPQTGVPGRSIQAGLCPASGRRDGPAGT